MMNSEFSTNAYGRMKEIHRTDLLPTGDEGGKGAQNGLELICLS